MDKGKAVTACAHKLARLIYTLVTKDESDVDQGRLIKNLTKRAEALDFELTAIPEVA